MLRLTTMLVLQGVSDHFSHHKIKNPSELSLVNLSELKQKVGASRCSRFINRNSNLRLRKYMMSDHSSTARLIDEDCKHSDLLTKDAYTTVKIVRLGIFIARTKWYEIVSALSSRKTYQTALP